MRLWEKTTFRNIQLKEKEYIQPISESYGDAD